MAQPRVIYNCQALFVGPAPETDYNFYNYYDTTPTNDYSNLVQKINRLNPIDRIQSVSYNINVPHTDVMQLNQRGIVDRPIINYPTVDLTFNYLLCGTKNEARLGLDVNYPLFNFPFSGESYYTENESVSLLSGFFETNKNKKIKNLSLKKLLKKSSLKVLTTKKNTTKILLEMTKQSQTITQTDMKY